MKVFLTGATGYIGSAVTERLRAAGHEVSALARSDASAGKLAATGIPAGFVESAQKEGAARYVGTGENRWPFVHVDDLAELYLLALENAPPGTLLLGVSGPAFRVAEVAAAASRGAGAGGKTTGWPLEQARAKLGPSADALVLDQQASGKKAETLLGWRPSRPNVLDDLEHGSYVPAERSTRR